jgi:hypothetical protein
MQILGPKRLNRALGRNLVDKGGATDLFSSAPLDLRFALQKTLDPRITFTRASSGTYVGSDGLVKTAVTNLLLRSEEFGTSWTATRASVSSDVIASPSGTMTADALTEDTSASLSHVLVQGSLNIISGLNYTFSCYAKRASGSRNVTVTLRAASFGTNVRTNVDLSTGVVTPVGSPLDFGATSIGDGWWRVWVTATATVSGTSSVDINLADVTTLSYTGDGTSGIYLWGAQLEQSSTVGEYIPTTSTINSAPRFDHNPTTGESLGLLLEEARTNLVLQSEDLSTSWTNINTSETTNAATAPDGTTTADKLAEAATTTEHSIRQDSTSQAAGTYTFSIFAKAAERTFLQFAATGVLGGFRANFNIGNGTLGSSDPELIASIVSYGNGWYKCIVTRTTTATGALRSQWNIVTSSSAARVESYAGDGTSGLLLWGAQLETGAFATSYIPTTTATATRALDVASITGANFSSWYNQTEGTVFGQFLRTASTNTQQGRVFSFSDGSNTNALEIYQTGGSNPSAQITATTGQALWTPSGFTVGTSIKEILGYKLNNSNASFNGSAETLDTVCNIPTVTQARIGDRQDGVRTLNGTIQRLTYWPTRLADTTLQQITQP